MSQPRESRFSFVIEAAARVGAPFRRFNQSIGQASERLAELQRRASDVTRGFSQASGFSQIAHRAGEVGAAMGNLTNETKKAVGGIMSLATRTTLVFGVAGGGAFALAKSVANAGDAAAKASARAGVAVENWQGFAHAADMAGVSAADLEKGIQNLSKNALSSRQAGSTQALWFKRAGIDAFNEQGSLKSNEKLFLEAADAIKKYVDAGEEAKAQDLARGLLGEQGIKMIPLLKEGSEGLREMSMEAQALGLVFSAEQAAEAENFNDAISEAQKSLKGMAQTVVREFEPHLIPVIKRFTEYIKDNLPKIQEKAKELALRFKEYIPEFIESLEDVVDKIKAIWNIGDKLAQTIGGWGNVFLGFAAVLTGKVVLALMATAAEVIALGAAFALTPLGATILAVLALAAAIKAVYDNREKIKDIIVGGETAKEHAKKFIGPEPEYNDPWTEFADYEDKGRAMFFGSKPESAKETASEMRDSMAKTSTSHTETNITRNDVYIHTASGVTATDRNGSPLGSSLSATMLAGAS